MREILFRGKRIDNGEWVEGYYFERKDTKGNIIESVIIMDAYEQITSGQRYMRSNLNYECFRVNSETVGMFTGLLDKNCKRIYEGDIMNNAGNIVEFCNGSFCINGDSDLAFWTGTEIIGNIYDNIELIG